MTHRTASTADEEIRAPGPPASEQGSAFGAALLGHVALGHLGSVDDATLVATGQAGKEDPS
jgi:hypothetical protein